MAVKTFHDGKLLDPDDNCITSESVYISIGSNLGNKIENVLSGIERLANDRQISLTGRSDFYKTEPVDYLDQNWFVNCAVKIQTRLNPFVLLDRLKSIQRLTGRRKKTIRFGPRILDLDIILYGDHVIQHSDIVIPHPRMHKRRFVLKPLCDIDPQVVHPVFKKDIKYLLNNLDDEGQRIIRISCDC